MLLCGDNYKMKLIYNQIVQMELKKKRTLSKGGALENEQTT